MARLRDLVAHLDALAPLSAAAEWDNVGLLAGDPAAHVARVLFTIDLTRDVLAEAVAASCELVVSYHPPLFRPVTRLAAGHVVFDAIAAHVAVYSPHTALDAAPGGTNDVLADAVGMTERAPLDRFEPKDDAFKLVVFVPAPHADEVSRAMFEAGAGRIGAYSSCSFRSAGTGTFFGEAGARPVVGEAGRLETVDEVRVETVVPIARAADVVAAMRAAHPYEEPAFDLVRLAARPAAIGMGRVGNIARTSRRAVVDQVKRALGAERVLVAGALDGDAARVAVLAGSGGEHVEAARAAGADVYVTGELRHHDALAAASSGMTVVCALHSVSERVALPSFAERLRARVPGLDVAVSTRDRDPFQIV
jgi:dinuclear metal center YbgI/SA1388 family protein